MNTRPRVHICAIETPESASGRATIEKLAESLPGDLQKAIGRKKYVKDRLVRAAGWLLLQYQLVLAGYDASLLAGVQKTPYGKPFIAGAFNFSISYSGNFAVCAVADLDRLGIDIEIIRDIDLDDFSRYFSDTEWGIIVHSKDPQKCFFQYWTKKESILKADGRGLYVDLRNVAINETHGTIRDSSSVYYLSSLPTIGDQVAASFCSDQPNTQLTVKRIEVASLTLSYTP